MTISENCEVTLNFRVIYPYNGQMRTYSRRKFVYVHGQSQLWEELEKALCGRNEGDRLQVQIIPNRSFHDEASNILFLIPRKNSSDSKSLQDRNGHYLGQKFSFHSRVSGVFHLQVSQIRRNFLVLRALRPEKCDSYYFDIEVVKVGLINSMECV